jgi:3-hydroxyacyl-CoA dehydrogenase
MHALHTAEKLGFSAETVDTITGPFIGRPKSGTFRLADLIGFDIIADVCGNLRRRCSDDPHTDVLQIPAVMTELGNSGWIGNKAGQGYYKKEGDQFLTYDAGIQQYRPRIEPSFTGIEAKKDFGERIRDCLESTGEVGEFIREHLPPALAYATYLGPKIAHRASDFDNVMKWGWGWSVGPFEMMDLIGRDVIHQFAPSQTPPESSPFYEEGKELDFETLEHVPRRTDARFASVSDFEITKSGEGWAIRDDQLGGHIFELRKKMGALDAAVVRSLVELLQSEPDARITLASSQPAFSVGYDLQHILQYAEAGQFEEMAAELRELQRAGVLLSKARSAAAVHGYGLGGGFELALRCRTVVVHNEAMVGLPEVLVGLVPAGGGTAEMRRRTNGDVKRMCAAAVSLAGGRKYLAASARKADFIRSTDLITANPDSLLFRALHVQREEPQQMEWTSTPPMVAGMIDTEIDKMTREGELGEYGEVIAGEIKHVFVKSTSEAHALEMEIEAFLRLMGKPRTHLRIRHMLETGKPVNN